MANIDRHPAGSFCWIELATADQTAAKTFYSSLFGWDPQDSPMGPGEFYTIFRLNGRDAAAGYTLRPDQRAQHVPPHWMIYITVENTDAVAAKAQGLGGTILGILMSYGAAALIHALQPASLPMIIVYEWWPRTGAITVLGALLGALYPGLTAAAPDPIEALSYE